MTRLRHAAVTGNLSAAIDDTDTVLTSPQFADLPVVAAPDYLVLLLDPTEIDGSVECVYVTAHTSLSTSVTVSRGEEAPAGHGSARAHTDGTYWLHGPTPTDYNSMATLFIYNSSAAAWADRTFNDWAELCDALALTHGPKRIEFQQDETIPTDGMPVGGWNLNGATLCSDAFLPPGFTITFPEGCKLDPAGLSVRTTEGQLTLYSESTEPVVTIGAGASIFGMQAGTIGSSFAPFILVDDPAAVFVLALRDSAALALPSEGGVVAGDYEVLEVNDAAFAGVVTYFAGQIHDNTIRGTGSVQWIRQEVTTSLDLPFGTGLTQTNLASWDADAKPGAAELIRLDELLAEHWPQGVPDDVRAAVLDLAARGDYVFTYDPDGVAGGNVYTSWPALMDAVATTPGPKEIFVPGQKAVADAGMPVGGWNLNGAALVGEPGLSMLTFTDGAKLDPAGIGWLFARDITLLSESTEPVIAVGAGDAFVTSLVGGTCALMSRFESFIEIDNPGGTAVIQFLGGALVTLPSNAGDMGGDYESINVVDAAMVMLVAELPSIKDDTVRGTAALFLYTTAARDHGFVPGGDGSTQTNLTTHNVNMLADTARIMHGSYQLDWYLNDLEQQMNTERAAFLAPGVYDSLERTPQYATATAPLTGAEISGWNIGWYVEAPRTLQVVGCKFYLAVPGAAGAKIRLRFYRLAGGVADGAPIFEKEIAVDGAAGWQTPAFSPPAYFDNRRGYIVTFQCNDSAVELYKPADSLPGISVGAGETTPMTVLGNNSFAWGASSSNPVLSPTGSVVRPFIAWEID